jgi:hypothetical protein
MIILLIINLIIIPLLTEKSSLNNKWRSVRRIVNIFISFASSSIICYVCVTTEYDKTLYIATEYIKYYVYFWKFSECAAKGKEIRPGVVVAICQHDSFLDYRMENDHYYYIVYDSNENLLYDGYLSNEVDELEYDLYLPITGSVNYLQLIDNHFFYLIFHQDAVFIGKVT